MISMTHIRFLAAGFLGLALLGFSGAAQTPSSPTDGEKEKTPLADKEQPAVDPKFEKAALAASGDYRNWSMVDDAWRWAPTLCDSPSPTRTPRVSQLRKSKSEETDSHGRKMYRLYAKDGPAYAELSKGIGASPAKAREGQVVPTELKDVTQVVVKESWIPEHAAAKAAANDNSNAPAPAAKSMKQSDLFMMLKMGAAKEPGTDEGWIYATVTPDGKEVTGAGRMQTCMKCHADAPHGRLFGLKPIETANDSKGKK